MAENQGFFCVCKKVFLKCCPRRNPPVGAEGGVVGLSFLTDGSEIEKDRTSKSFLEAGAEPRREPSPVQSLRADLEARSNGIPSCTFVGGATGTWHHKK